MTLLIPEIWVVWDFLGIGYADFFLIMSAEKNLPLEERHTHVKTDFPKAIYSHKQGLGFKVSSLSWKRHLFFWTWKKCSGDAIFKRQPDSPCHGNPWCWSLNNWTGDTKKSNSSLPLPTVRAAMCHLLRCFAFLSAAKAEPRSGVWCVT